MVATESFASMDQLTSLTRAKNDRFYSMPEFLGKNTVRWVNDCNHFVPIVMWANLACFCKCSTRRCKAVAPKGEEQLLGCRDQNVEQGF